MSFTNSPTKRRTIAVGFLAFVLACAVWIGHSHHKKDLPSIPPFSTDQDIGKVHPALNFRIVSFHRGRADKNLILLARQLGFNGVQFQIEGSTVKGVQDFADRDAREHLIDFCHSLNMQVTLWVHEFSDLPDETDPAFLGPATTDNAKLWNVISDRYDWFLTKVVPNIDGLVLTTVETQVNATNTAVMLKLTNLIDQKCRDHGKYMIARTFVWHPDELDQVMGAVKQMPAHIPIMSKIVPQDWQMRGDMAAELGAVGEHEQIVEFDAEGEYFLRDNAANCMVDLLKQQYDYAVARHARGICVRVDRDDSSVIFEPQEVNLWTLGLLSAGATDNTSDIWTAWANYRYGPRAAPAVVAALKPTGDVVSEMLSVGPFTYGDTRQTFSAADPRFFPALPYEDILSQNWQNWRWNEKYFPALVQASAGDPAFISQIRASQKTALEKADACLANLEKAKPDLPEREYAILHTRLLSNKIQLQFRTAATLAALDYRAMFSAQTGEQSAAAREQYLNDLAPVQTLAAALKAFPKPRNFDYLGKTWSVDAPLAITAPAVQEWLNEARQLPGPDDADPFP